MSNRPSDYASWPAEIRALYDVAIRSADTDAAAAVEALEHLFDLAKQRDDLVVASAARWASLELWMKFAPEQMAAHLFRDRGQRAIELAASILQSPNADSEARMKAEEIIEKMAAEFPPKGRA
jgi:hypothetical protein